MDYEVVYLVNGDSTYVEMVKTSVHLLRRHNRDISVRVFLIDDARFPQPVDLVHFCADHNVAVIQRTDVNTRYFQDNKVYVAESPAARVLLLDADTFVFADVVELFDAYAGADVAACSNDWVWARGYRSGAIAGSPVPLNSGVVLCSAEFLRDWTRRMPRLHAGLLTGTSHPELSRWLRSVSSTAYNREEFALTIVGAEGPYRVQLFAESDCKLLKYRRLANDLSDFRRCTKIFHSYSQHWRACLRYL